jgi:hypothetical protein
MYTRSEPRNPNKSEWLDPIPEYQELEEECDASDR